MSKYKEILNRIDKKELEDYYRTHLPKDTCKKFNIESFYLLKTILKRLGIPPHTPRENSIIQFSNMSDEERNSIINRIVSSNYGRVVSAETRKKISDAQRGKPRNYDTSKFKSHQFKKGNVPWNKGKKGLQHWVDGQAERRWSTMLANGTVGNRKTNIESVIEQDLINRYGEEHIHYQYSDNRYPFKCDFYVDTEDLFIEVNNWWHHGPHPYDENDVADQELLNCLIEKSIQNPEQRQWKEAIKTWTVRDVEKMQVAKKNHLNYITIYSYNNEFK